MSAAWWAFQIIINIFESVAICYFIQKHFPGRFSVVGNRLVNVGMVAFVSGIYTFYYIWVPPRMVDNIGLILFWLVYVLLFRKGSWYEKCFWSFLIVGVTMVITSSAVTWTMLISGIPFIEVVFWQGVPRILLVGIVKTLHVLAYIYFSKYYITSRAMEVKIYIYFIAIIFISVYISTTLMTTVAEIDESLILMFLLTLSALSVVVFMMIIFYLFHSISTQGDLLLKTQGELQHKILMEQHNNELVKIYKDMRDWRHDFHNHIQSLLALSQEGNKEEMKKYVEQLGHKLVEIEGVCHTGQQALDAIVSVKCALAATYEIAVKLHMSPITMMPISELDVTSLFGNLFDNAIEACRRMDTKKRSIDLSLGMMGRMICIRMTNTTNGEERVHDGRYLTVKTDKQLHGLGIANIDRIVSSANGVVERKHEDRIFNTVIILPSV